ncbi:MAG: acyl-CoA dehydrogenase [Sulfobacillus thermosulfidooxidans]|nr:MAG: acyl-CoA dehydrogenase [Sulfobacillus thermosulfidooxidans]
MSQNIIQPFPACDNTHMILQELRDRTSAIDEHGEYPGFILKEMGAAGCFEISGLNPGEAQTKRLRVIEWIATTCASTAFLAWCQSSAILYVNASENMFLTTELLPALETVQLLGGTAMSNPMKYYSGMEPLRLKAVPSGDDYLVTGVVPFVSNLGSGHWFGALADVATNYRIMMMIPCDTPGLTLIEDKDFAALNGTRTFSCRFDAVKVSRSWIIDANADQWVQSVRPAFVLSQVGIGLGLVQTAIDHMDQVRHKQQRTNEYLSQQPDDFRRELMELRHHAYQLAMAPVPENLPDILEVRQRVAELALDAAQHALLAFGAAGFMRRSTVLRRWREALFFAILTPAIKQLRRDRTRLASSLSQGYLA